MSVAYHLISYNFELYDFEKFRNEEKTNGGEVYWNYGERRHKFNIGDICYIYCTNLPDMTKRILLKAEVSDLNCTDPQNPTLNCFKIRNIHPILLKEPETKSEKELTYGYENLKKLYHIKTVQGKQKLDAEGIHRELVEKLKQEPDTGTLNSVKIYYNRITKCVFDGHDKNPKTHKTFIKPNGFNYFETHHIIQQNTLKYSQLSEEIINDPKNKVYLCPTCHSKIHYGNHADVRKMLEELYYRDSEEKIFLDECAQKVGETDTLKWLYIMYKVE